MKKAFLLLVIIFSINCVLAQTKNVIVRDTSENFNTYIPANKTIIYLVDSNSYYLITKAYAPTDNMHDVFNDNKYTLVAGEKSIEASELWIDQGTYLEPKDGEDVKLSDTGSIYFGEDYIKNYDIPDSAVRYFTDSRDDQEYKAVKIGTQWWMAENLNYDTAGGYCYNDSCSVYADTYGRLYKWDSAMGGVTTEGVRGICPEGWHIPTDAEWTTLTTFLGGTGVAGGKLKEVGTTHWNSSNTGATDEYGFTALPGGYIYSNGDFYYIGYYAYFWSSTEYNSIAAWYWSIYYSNDDILPKNNFTKEFGRSVRCLKDEPFASVEQDYFEFSKPIKLPDTLMQLNDSTFMIFKNDSLLWSNGDTIYNIKFEGRATP